MPNKKKMSRKSRKKKDKIDRKKPLDHPSLKLNNVEFFT